ncbi:MAG TPA: hypothetical protein VH500_23695 [Nitrososphaeraceae archaeon]
MDDLVDHSCKEVKIAWFSASNSILLPLCDKIGIRSRQFRISYPEVWQAYANTCLVVSYCDDRGNDIGPLRQNTARYRIGLFYMVMIPPSKGLEESL